MNRFLYTLMICCFLGIGATLAGPNYQKYIDKAEESLSEGDYEKALKHLGKLEKKSTKKIGKLNPYVPYISQRRSAIALYSGYLEEFAKLSNYAYQQSIQVHGKGSIEHSEVILDIVENYLTYGDALSAEKYLTEAKDILLNSEKEEDYAADLDILTARIFSLKGYYRQALDLLLKHEDQFLSQTAEKVSYLDESGNLVSEKVDKDKLTRNRQRFAFLLNTKGRVLHEMGAFLSADSALLYTQNWIEENMDRKNIEYARNQYFFGLMLDENGVRDLPGDYYETAYYYMEKDHEPTHYLAMDIRIKVMSYLVRSDQTGKLKTLAKGTNKVVSKNYKDESLLRSRLKYIGALINISEEDKLEVRYKHELYSILRDELIPANHPLALEIAQVLYRADILPHNYQEAYKRLIDAKEVARNIYGEDAPKFHLHRLFEAEHWINYGTELDEAAQVFEESFDGVIKQIMKPGYVHNIDLMRSRAKLYELKDEFTKANQTLEQALLYTRQKYSDQDIKYGIVLEQVANLQINIGKYQKAQENIDAAIRILEEFDQYPRELAYLVMAYETRARLYGIYADYGEAEDDLKDAAKAKKKAAYNPDYDEFESFEELAGLYIDLGKYADTERILDELITRKEERFGKDSRFLIRPLTDRAALQLVFGEYTEAQKTATRAGNIAERVFGKNSTVTAYPLNAQINVYTTLGDYDRAEELLRENIDLYKSKFGQDHLDVANALSKLALIQYYKNENIKEIQANLEVAQEIIGTKIGENTPQYADILKDLSMVSLRKGDFEEALKYLRQSESIWKEKAGKRNNIKLGSVIMLIGDVYYYQKQYRDAEKSYEDAADLYEDFFSENHPEYVKLVSRLAKVYFMQGDKRKARNTIDEALDNYHDFIDDYFPSLSEREKTKYWNTIRDDYEFYVTMTLQLKDKFPELVHKLYNNALLTKALLLSSSIKMRERIVDSKDEELKQLYYQWLDEKEELTTALSMSTAQLEDEGISLDRLKDAVEDLEKELSERSEAFAGEIDKAILTWEDIHKTLEDNDVAMEVIRARYFDHEFTDSVIYALVYVKGGRREEPQVLVLNNGKELETKYINNYRNSIKYRIPDRFSYAQYWEPIKSQIGSFANLYFSPDGVFNQINLEAIPAGEGGYVLDNANIILVNNTKDLHYKAVADKQRSGDNTDYSIKRATMFGDPDFYVKIKDDENKSTMRGDEIADLPGTEEEIKMLQSILSTEGWQIDYYLDSAASEDKVKLLNNPNVFHIATHGFFQPMPDQSDLLGEVSEAQAAENPLLRSGLLLTGAGDLLSQTLYNYNIENGVLTAYEAMNLNLDETELVVLSACETGLGDITIGEGVYGLQRAFLVAGAKNLIMSLFKVSDEATQKLMVEFYQNWLASGDKRQAFITAKKAIREEYKDPLYWGAFVMIGI